MHRSTLLQLCPLQSISWKVFWWNSAKKFHKLCLLQESSHHLRLCACVCVSVSVHVPIPIPYNHLLTQLSYFSPFLSTPKCAGPFAVNLYQSESVQPLEAEVKFCKVLFVMANVHAPYTLMVSFMHSLPWVSAVRRSCRGWSSVLEWLWWKMKSCIQSSANPGWQKILLRTAPR